MKRLLFLIIILGCSGPYASSGLYLGGTDMGNGGDLIRVKFIEYGKEIIEKVQNNPEFSTMDPQNLSELLREDRVKVGIDKKWKDFGFVIENDIIWLDYNYWFNGLYQFDQDSIILHILLVAIGIEDKDYGISKKINQTTNYKIDNEKYELIRSCVLDEHQKWKLPSSYSLLTSIEIYSEKGSENFIIVDKLHDLIIDKKITYHYSNENYFNLYSRFVKNNAHFLYRLLNFVDLSSADLKRSTLEIISLDRWNLTVENIPLTCNR